MRILMNYRIIQFMEMAHGSHGEYFSGGVLKGFTCIF